MGYWHQRENGTWSFDWSHLIALIPIAAFVTLIVVKWLSGHAVR